jgi:hypothetical protein
MPIIRENAWTLAQIVGHSNISISQRVTWMELTEGT